MNPNLFFSSRKERRDEEGEEGGRGRKRSGGGSALPSVRAAGGASLCRCRSHQSQGPCTGSTGRGEGLRLPLSDLIGQRRGPGHTPRLLISAPDWIAGFLCGRGGVGVGEERWAKGGS